MRQHRHSYAPVRCSRRPRPSPVRRSCSAAADCTVGLPSSQATAPDNADLQRGGQPAARLGVPRGSVRHDLSLVRPGPDLGRRVLAGRDSTHLDQKTAKQWTIWLALEAPARLSSCQRCCRARIPPAGSADNLASTRKSFLGVVWGYAEVRAGGVRDPVQQMRVRSGVRASPAPEVSSSGIVRSSFNWDRALIPSRASFESYGIISITSLSGGLDLY